MERSPRIDILIRWLDPALVGLVGVLYILRLYPNLWWGDEPELLTATWCNGVAHPTGYPLFLLLQKFSLLFPMGSVAWRGHLFSSVTILLGVGFLLRLVKLYEDDRMRALGWRVGVLILSLAPLLRKQGMVAEVYGLSFLFVALLITLATRFAMDPKYSTLIAIAAVAGLGFGHHRLIGFMLPGLALYLVQPLKTSELGVRPILAALVAFSVSVFLPYTLLWFRAHGSPPLNWEDPSTLSNLWRVFSAAQFRLDQKIVRAQEWLSYQERTGPHPWGITLADIRLLPALWWSNLGFSLPLGGLGVGMLFHRSPRVLVAGFIAWLLPTLFVAQYHVADRETFHLLPVILVGLTLAAGWAFLFEWSASKHSLLPLLLLPIVGLFLVQQASNLQSQPKELAGLPEAYSNHCLDEVPPGGVLLAVSVSPNTPVDYTYFPLLYQKQVAKRGQHLALISEGFFTTPWYCGTLRREGIPVSLFDALEKGTPKIPLKKADLKSFLGVEIPHVQASSQGSSPPLAIFEVDGRYFLANRYTQGALVAETLIPSISHRPLYFTSRFPEIEPYLKGRIEWTEVFRIPMLTQGYVELDGMPIPSGKLFRASLFSNPSPSPNLK
jgi:hypothetical protein